MKKLILLILFLGSFDLFSQKKFKIFDTINAPLLTNIPIYIIQDRDNSYWIAFFNEYLPSGGYKGGGIMRFDGINWQIFNSANSPLHDYDFNAIAIDSLGRKWFASDSGLIMYDGAHWKIYAQNNTPIFQENIFWNVSVERDTIIWVSGYTTGVYRFDGVNWSHWHRENSPLNSNKISFIETDRYGVKWIGATYSPLYSFDGFVWRKHGAGLFDTTLQGLMAPIAIYDIAFDKDDYKWIIGFGKDPYSEITKYAYAKFKDTSWTIYTSVELGFKFTPEYNGLVIDKNGVKWFSDRFNGFVSYNDSVWKHYDTTYYPVLKSNCINVDKHNNKIMTGSVKSSVYPDLKLGAIIFFNENGVILSTEKDKEIRPHNFYISQNYPNPFNTNTKFDYYLVERGHVKIDLLNLLGQKIKTLVDTEKDAGLYTYYLDSKDLASGVYFIIGKNGDLIEKRKILLLK